MERSVALLWDRVTTHAHLHSMREHYTQVCSNLIGHRNPASWWFVVTYIRRLPTNPSVRGKKITASHHVVKVTSYGEGISPLGFASTWAISLSLFYSSLSKNNGGIWWSARWLDAQALLWNYLMGKQKKETSGPYGTRSPRRLAASMIQDDTASTFQHSHLILP